METPTIYQQGQSLTPGGHFPVTKIVDLRTTSWPADLFPAYQGPAGGGGYWDHKHAYVDTNGLHLPLYTDPTTPFKGATGGGVQFSDPFVAPGGGVAACVRMGKGPGTLKLVDLIWSAANNWNQGEGDLDEGPGSSLMVYIHQVGSNPAANDFSVAVPIDITDGNYHILGATWDTTTGWEFFTERGVFQTLTDVKDVPTAPFHFCIQTQDTGVTSIPQGAPVNCDVLWVAMAGQYVANPVTPTAPPPPPGKAEDPALLAQIAADQAAVNADQAKLQADTATEAGDVGKL